MEVFFIIIFILIGYGIIGALVSAYWNILWNKNQAKLDKDDKEFITRMLWFFWPFSFVVLLIYYIPYTYIFKKIIK